MVDGRIARLNESKVLRFLSVTKNLDNNYKSERIKRYGATQRKKKLGTKLFTQL